MLDLIAIDLNSHTDNASSIDIFIEYHSLFGHGFNREKSCSAWLKIIFNQADSIFQQDYWIDVNCVDMSTRVFKKTTYYLNGEIWDHERINGIDFSSEINEEIINYIINHRPNNITAKYDLMDNKRFECLAEAFARLNIEGDIVLANPFEIYIDKYSIKKSKKYLNNTYAYTCNFIIQDETEHSIMFQEALIEIDCSHELITILKITSFYMDGSHTNETATKDFTFPDFISNEVINYVCKNKK